MPGMLTQIIKEDRIYSMKEYRSVEDMFRLHLCLSTAFILQEVVSARNESLIHFEKCMLTI